MFVDDRVSAWSPIGSGLYRLIASGEIELIELTLPDWKRSAQLVQMYADLRLGLVDASIVAVAERLNLTTIATMTHRDFAVVRPAHCDAFELLP